MTDKHVDKGKGRLKEAAGGMTGGTSLTQHQQNHELHARGMLAARQ